MKDHELLQMFPFASPVLEREELFAFSVEISLIWFIISTEF